MITSIIEEISSAEIELGINDLSRIIPLVRSLITPVLNAAYEYHNTYGNIKLYKVTASQGGVWQTSVGVNAHTKHFHTENDSTYTVVNIIKQAKVNKGKDNRENLCIFKLKEGHN